MKFTEAINAIELVMMTNDVPLLVGESGIGKTSMIKELAKKNNSNLVNIDANLLKEGEIGGLPFVDKGKTIYATHYKLEEVRMILDKEEKDVILFIDELNRCEHAVQQELMNLILNREINGYKVDPRVKIIAAMNPSNKYENFENSDYRVVDMDSAQEDRFVWIQLDSDVKEWISWAMTQKANISEEIIEFISQFPNYLHSVDSNESIKPTPRSWERVSKAFQLYKKNREKYSVNTLYNVVKGNVGGSIATDFIGFVSDFKNAIITVDDLLQYEYIPYEMKELISNESHSRLYILAEKILQRFQEEKFNEKLEIFGEVLLCYPKDLRLGIMKDIKSNYGDTLYSELLDKESFLQAFFNIYE